VIVFGAVSAMPADIATKPLGTGVEFVNFMAGFLEGLNVKGDFSKIIECLRNGEGIIKKIMDAINKLATIDFFNIVNIVLGVTMLVDAVKDINNMIKSCTMPIPEFQKLINALTNINFAALTLIIIKNSMTLIGTVTDTIDAFRKLDFKRAGKGIGHLLYILFLDSALKLATIADPAAREKYRKILTLHTEFSQALVQAKRALDFIGTSIETQIEELKTNMSPAMFFEDGPNGVADTFVVEMKQLIAQKDYSKICEIKDRLMKGFDHPTKLSSEYLEKLQERLVEKVDFIKNMNESIGLPGKASRYPGAGSIHKVLHQAIDNKFVVKCHQHPLVFVGKNSNWRCNCCDLTTIPYPGVSLLMAVAMMNSGAVLTACRYRCVPCDFDLCDKCLANYLAASFSTL
jgi:hypothetical protein